MSPGLSRWLPWVAAVLSLALQGADWTRFRGPDATGVSPDRDTPAQWSATEGVLWKTALPGAGGSSPITLGDKVFITCYSGFGLDPDEPGEQKGLKHHVVCIHRADGHIVWDKSRQASLPETDYRGFVTLHGYASATPATDGKAVYAFFGRSGVVAYDLTGELLWHASVGDRLHAQGWGSAASPIVWQRLVVVNASIESDSLVALDATSGKEVWRVGGIARSWSTPLVVSLPDGREELVVSLEGKVLGLDPETGKEIWRCDGIPDYVVPSVIAHQGIVYVTAGRRGMTLAIRAGGKGDVTKTHLLWKLAKSPKVGTPLYSKDHLFWIGHQGVAVCVQADTGKVVYEERLDVRGRGDKVYSSLVAADGKLYGVTREDGTFILDASPQFRQPTQSRLGDQGVFNATPVIADGRLLLRSDRYLYCIGK